ncbi:site-specific recombinase [Caenimonas terrae]|uniref:Site-specific recombinase n=1 Tax=Caenimonas terrae TaxID=696074 RepID=A0ABW0N923_9BURK
MTDLNQVLATLDAQAPLAQRHLWLIGLLQWVRGPRGSPAAAAASRVRLFLDALEAQPQLQQRVRDWWQVLAETVDATALLADFGFAPRMAFISEFNERLRQKLLPATPETTDSAELFSLAMPRADDALWIAALDADSLERLADLLTTSSAVTSLTLWQHELLEAINYCASQVRAAGFAAELRQRMSAPSRELQPFHELPADVEAFRAAFAATPREPAVVEAAAARLRERLEACRHAAASVYPHLNEHGISVGLVFLLRQLRERVLRIRELMDCLTSPTPQASSARLVSRLAAMGHERRSLRALLAANSSLLAAKVTERSAEAGEHYITRTPAEYRQMLWKAAGGGAATAATTFLKFALASLGLAAFWGGFWAGMMYAASFVFIQLMHWTLATKQPAMTAPAMAARLKNLDQPGAVEEFVDEVANLMRSQVAAVIGNVGMVVPCVVLLSAAIGLASGAPMISREDAHHVFETLHLLNPLTLLFAAFTGVLLFASSLIAGWTENWFVLHRLDSAMRYNPRITAALGSARAGRWAGFMRNNISGFASNISLGMMLGLVPPVLGFIGIGLQARHVTLSSGQLAAAAAAYGPQVLGMPELWWCIAAIPFIAMLNLGVSFYFAFRLALRAHSVVRADRLRIRHAILARLRQRPASFLLPL